ncbi:MAG: DEAD/DEAH box helicase family protein [Bacteroidales bacterium]|nr:DEAD/DEAH box helicase family protein [Bacteroidales bacterium]
MVSRIESVLGIELLRISNSSLDSVSDYPLSSSSSFTSPSLPPTSSTPSVPESSSLIPTDADSQSPPESQDTVSSSIIFPEITRDLAISFYSMFHGRKDVYAVRSKTKGYHTQCLNFWKYGICPKIEAKREGKKAPCHNCPSQDYTELKVSAIISHLRGEKEDCTDVIGLYPLFPDGTCYYLVFDFDDHHGEGIQGTSSDWRREVDAMRSVCSSLSVDCLVERSRSGNGAHIWIFFDKAVPAYKARRFGEALILKGSESVNMTSFRYFDRMIPKQDSPPPGGLGNLVALPLQGRALLKGNSAFVDENWIPYPDQWGKLFSVRKLTLDEMDSLLLSWNIGDNPMKVFAEDTISYEADGDEEDTPLLFGSSPKPSLSSFVSSDVDGEVRIILSDGIYVDKTGLKPRIQNAMRRIAAYSNSAFFKNLKLGLSTEETPRIIYAGYDSGRYIVLPRGCYDDLTGLLSSSGICFSIHDARNSGKKISATFTGTLKPEQKEAADALLSSDNGVSAAATAFGKTVLGVYLIAQRKVNTLILVPTSEIMDGWIRSLSSFLSFSEELPTYTTPSGRVRSFKSHIGTYSSSKKALTGIVDVAMISSMGKDDNLNPVLRDYGMVIVDECHHVSAASHENVLRAVNSRFVYGLTATPRREDGLTRSIFMQLGPIRYRFTAKERAARQGIGHFVYPRFTRYVDPEAFSSDGDRRPYDLRKLATSEGRNAQIISDVEKCLSAGRTPVVITNFREHAKAMADSLLGKADHVFLLRGGESGKRREEIRSLLFSVPDSESAVIVATTQYLSEGFDYPRLDTLLLTIPVSSANLVEQLAGRLNRDYHSKKDVIIYDYIDANVGKLERMYGKRLPSYKRIGFGLCSELVDRPIVRKSIYGDDDFWDVLQKDILSSMKEVIVSSRILSSVKVRKLLSLSGILSERGVKLYVVTLSPFALSHTDHLEEHQSRMVDSLSSGGVRVKLKEGVNNCSSYAIIDGRIVWYGGSGILSRGNPAETLMRTEDAEIAEEILLGEFGKGEGRIEKEEVNLFNISTAD